MPAAGICENLGCFDMTAGAQQMGFDDGLRQRDQLVR